jgi:hypothetical protein
MAEDTRLTKLTKIALALPETSRTLMGEHATFLVRKKVFAYFLNDHHGDSIVSICCRSLPGDNKRLAEGDAKRFYLPAYIGPRGWVGLRLDFGKVDWDEVGEFLRGGYVLAAPKTLAARVMAKAEE